ncbi:hypothetical protein JTB14_024661 [Gonioctena quinquepunctata]|nr:hypothetical protein JTB14_024661 [Gonioctena quinquepunctata]
MDDRIEKKIEDTGKKIMKLEDEIDEMEQYNRRKDIRIYGIAENSRLTDNEQVEEVLENMNIQQKPLMECYRIGKPKNGTNDKPRPIFVKFHNLMDKTEVIRNRKEMKGAKIFIKEDLTSARFWILMKATEKFGYQNVWSMNGNIFTSENGNKKESRNRTL